MKRILLTIPLVLIWQVSFGQWVPFDYQYKGPTNGTIVDLHSDNGDPHNLEEIYATGFFTTIEGVPASYAAKYDFGVGNWVEVGGGLDDAGHAMEKIGDTLFLVRYELGSDSNWVHYLDNGSWKKLGSGFFLEGNNPSQFYTCNLFDVIEWDNKIVACGEFNRVGSDTINGIAWWDGSDWNPFGSGLSDPMFGSVINPHQLFVYNGDLLVCGNFLKAGGITVNGIAKWNGASWEAMGSGFDNTVYAIGATELGDLYVGGAFTMSGSTGTSMVARWNGTAWENPGFDLKMNNPQRFGFVHTIKLLDEGALWRRFLISGGFDEIQYPNGTVPAGSIAALIQSNGQYIDSLSTLNNGLNNDVEGLLYWDGAIVAGGFFTNTNDVANTPLSRIARFQLWVTGTDEFDDEHDAISVYPNPSHEEIRIDLEEIEIWQMTDLKGKIIMEGQEKKIDVRGIVPGSYLLRIRSGKGLKTLRFSKI